ncbi:MAG: hypothetical protein LBD34_03220 [Puniceicoccales bacterium]|nr:hypothetical protein [Puniceicoccales bacterium]
MARNSNKVAAKMQRFCNLAKLSIFDIMGAIIVNIFDVARRILDTMGEMPRLRCSPVRDHRTSKPCYAGHPVANEANVRQ